MTQYQVEIDDKGFPHIRGKAKFLEDMSHFKGQTLIAEFRKPKKSRTLKQNSFYFGNFIQSQIDCFKEMWGENYSVEQIHTWNKNNVFCEEKIDEETGEVFKMPQSSTKVGSKEWEDKLGMCRMFFQDKFNWTLPYPNSQSEMFIDPEAEHNKNTAIVPNENF